MSMITNEEKRRNVEVLYNSMVKDVIGINASIVKRAKEIVEQSSIKALGPVGMVKFLEEYDNGGNGDYTKEKYKHPDLSVDDILNMK